MSKSWLSGAGNKLHDVSHNSGTIIQATGSVTINNLGERVRANPEEECKRALFLTNPVDDKSGVETENKPLIAKSCEWIHQQEAFKTWFVDRGPDSQLLWVSGGLGMGKTMMALFLIREIERSHMHMQNGSAIVLYYFVDSRNHKRNTAVAILRGLIWRLIEWRPELLPLVVADFMAQREDLFNPSLSSSLEALFRIFKDMLRHEKTGMVHCIIDGLDELQEDNLQPFLRKVTKLFHDERQDMEDLQNGRLHPRVVPRFASLRMILLSRESPQCLLENLSIFPWISIEKATRQVTKIKTAKPAPQNKKPKAAVKLKTLALLALQKQRLENPDQITSAEGSETVVTEPDGKTIEQSLATLSLATKTDSTAELDGSSGVNGDGSGDYVFDEPVEDSGDDAVEDDDDAEQQAGSEEEVEEDGPVRSIALYHYIEAKVEELSQVRSYGEEIEKRVASNLQDKGDGTFLWVDLAIEELSLYETQHVEQVIQQLPASVNEIYMRSLSRIPEHAVPLISALFRWVLSAHQPLNLSELATALLQMGFMSPNPIEMVRQGLAACGTMLAINEETGEVHTTHTSVADFLAEKNGPLLSDSSLQRFHVDVEAFDGEIACICLRYLEQGCLNAGSVSPADGDKYLQRVAQFPLLPYAALFWPEHLRTATRPYLDLSSPFFAKKSVVRKNWWLFYYAVTTTKAAILAPRGDFTLLHMAAYLNLTFLAQQLEYMGEVHSRINTRDSHGSTPLFWAAATGSMEMFVFLLQRGASQECVGETIFEVACRKGQEDIVKYLLDLGQDVNARVAEQGILQTLGQATRWAHGIISEGTKLEADFWKLMVRDIGVGGTALHMTCLFGHAAVVKLLISRGAHVQIATDKGWTALHSASWTGKLDCVKLLIDAGSNPQGISHQGWNPLHCAASRGKHTVVSFYLAYGMPVDCMTMKRKTPLHLCAYTGSAATIRVLVEGGAYIDAQSHKGETPLHLAARAGEPEAVETLLSLGANRFMINNAGLPPAESLKAMATGLTINQKEALRVLEQFGMPGYVPWRPKVDPKAAAAAQSEAQGQSSPAPGQFSRTDSGFSQNSQPAATFMANFQFSSMTYTAEKPHPMRAETYPAPSFSGPGQEFDQRPASAAPPPPYSPSPAFAAQQQTQQKFAPPSTPSDLGGGVSPSPGESTATPSPAYSIPTATPRPQPSATPAVSTVSPPAPGFAQAQTPQQTSFSPVSQQPSWSNPVGVGSSHINAHQALPTGFHTPLTYTAAPSASAFVASQTQMTPSPTANPHAPQPPSTQQPPQTQQMWSNPSPALSTPVQNYQPHTPIAQTPQQAVSTPPVLSSPYAPSQSHTTPPTSGPPQHQQPISIPTPQPQTTWASPPSFVQPTQPTPQPGGAYGTSAGVQPPQHHTSHGNPTTPLPIPLQWTGPTPTQPPYAAAPSVQWAPPATQPANLHPQQSQQYGYSPSPYTPNAYSPSPHQQPLGFQAPQQQHHPQHQAPSQAHQPPSQYNPPPATSYQYPGARPPTTATGYLSVTGYTPGFAGGQQGGMGFAPPPGMGGPLPHLQKKKSIFSLGGIEITRK
jgi:ankyrin repeat protein